MIKRLQAMNHHLRCTVLLLVVMAHSFPTPTMAIKGGYWPSDRNSTFPASSIDFSYFTHVYYAFVQPKENTFELNITQFDVENLPKLVAAAHAHYPPVMVMLSVGGAASSLTVFEGLSSNQSTRAVFIGSSIAVARQFGLNGLDLDWEFPADAAQMSDLAQLFVEWRAAINMEAAASGLPRLLLSAAVYYASSLSLGGIARFFPAEAMACSLDWINAMCYDYYGGWDKTATGAPAALYDPNSNISTSTGIESWLAAGVPSDKIVMGIPLYGHSWELKDPLNTSIGAPAVNVGPGPDGIMLYSAIAEFNQNASARAVYDAETVSAYSYDGTSWVGYDDPQSAAAKVQYAKARRLGGYFFWALGYDDQSWNISRSAWNAWGG